MANVSRANNAARFYDSLTTLHRHMRSCGQCHSARKGNTPRDLCDTGVVLILNASDLYGDVMRLRIKAHNRKDRTVFACPDLTKHGKAYAATAEPLFVQYVQDGLF